MFLTTTLEWCRHCGTQHFEPSRCPGELCATGPERQTWRVTADVPGGMQGYGVLVAPVGDRFRARILTFPNILWTVPGGGGTIKFVGRTEAEAERLAIDFIRHHGHERGYTLRDELELVSGPAVYFNPTPFVHAPPRSLIQRYPRFERRLPIRFGRNRPIWLAVTGNLSLGGLFVSTEHPVTGGESIGLLLEMEHCKVPLRGSVVWSRPEAQRGLPTGMGLQILEPPAVYVRYVQALAA